MAIGVNPAIFGAGGGGEPQFPLSMGSRLGAWFDPTDAGTLTVDAAPNDNDVLQWADKSGNGLHLVTGTAPATGVATINGRNVLDFVDPEYLEKTAFPVPASGNITIFIVAAIQASNSQFDALVSMDATNDFQYDNSGAVAEFLGRLNVAGIGTSTGGGTDKVGIGARIFELRFDFTGGTFQARVNDVQDVSGSYTAKLGTSQTFRLCNNRAANNALSAQVGEILVVKDWEGTDLADSYNYLAGRWLP